MANWDIAVMGMIFVTLLGFQLAEGERARVRYIRAMQRCLMRIRDLIRYEQPAISQLLLRIELNGTKEEKELTQLLRETAKRLTYTQTPQILQVFVSQSRKRPGYGVLSREDRHVFENLLGGLGRMGLEEQLHVLDAAQARLVRREASLEAECDKRAKLIRTLGLTGGAAVFLILI